MCWNAAVGQLGAGGRVPDQLGAAIERVRLHRDEPEPDQVAHDLTHRLPGDARSHGQVGGPGAAAAQSAEDRVVSLLHLRIAEPMREPHHVGLQGSIRAIRQEYERGTLIRKRWRHGA